MKNTIAAQLAGLGFLQDGPDHILEIRTHKGAANARLLAAFECDDDGVWTGHIRSRYVFEADFNEVWDGEQPISAWLNRMEAKYWDA